MFYFYPLLTALIFSLILTPIIKTLAVRLQIVDLPKPRKIQKKPIPLLGGLAIFFAFSLTTIIFWQLGCIEDIKISAGYISALLLAGLILMIGGVLDDKYNLSPASQIIWPVLAIVIVLASGIKIQYVTNPLGGVLGFSVWPGIIIAFFWLLGMMYTTKILDGLDGLVSGITAIGAVIIFIVSLYWDVPSSGTSILALILAGCCLGFLVFNWHPAKIFLGEGGSLFCGFMLGVLAIISGSKIATALLIMGIPILDIVWVIIQRIWQKKPPTAADRLHLHYRLLDAGLSHRQTVIFLYLLTAAFGITSLFLHSTGKILVLGMLAVFTTILVLVVFRIYQKKHHGI